MIFVSTAAFHRFLRRRYPRILMWHRASATRVQLSANPFRPWILSRGTWPRMLHLYCVCRCCESSQYGIRFVRVWHHPCLKRNPWQPNQCKTTWPNAGIVALPRPIPRRPPCLQMPWNCRRDSHHCKARQPSLFAGPLQISPHD